MKPKNITEKPEYVRPPRANLDEYGREILDSTPIAPPVGYKRQPSLAEQIREMVRSERLAMEAEAMGYETFEEADDFEMDDLDPHSPYEADFDPPTSEVVAAFSPEPASPRPSAEPKAPKSEGGADGDTLPQ